MGTSIYDDDIFDPIKSDLESFQNQFVLSPELWGKFKISDLPGVDFSNWKEEKLIDNGKFSSELTNIPTEYGGIYVYSIEPNIIPNVGCYVMYIGKASKTKHENLRYRVQSYSKQLGDDYDRERLHRLFIKWGEYVHVHYLTVDADSDVITALEDRLIAAFGKPQCNAEIRITSVKRAIRAFN